MMPCRMLSKSWAIRPGDHGRVAEPLVEPFRVDDRADDRGQAGARSMVLPASAR